jgi:hypothetical protein
VLRRRRAAGTTAAKRACVRRPMPAARDAATTTMRHLRTLHETKSALIVDPDSGLLEDWTLPGLSEQAGGHRGPSQSRDRPA